MDFLKQHYEKILLTVVLLILAAAAAWLPVALAQERQELAALTGPAPNPKEYTAVNLAPYEQAIQTLASPPSLDFTGHNLFNPVPWKLKSDGTLIKIASGTEEGPGALVIKRIYPLHLIISYVRHVSPGTYEINIENEVTGQKSRAFVSIESRPGRVPLQLKEVKGPEDAPVLVLEFPDGEPVEVSKDKPFRRVETYAADLRYDLQNQDFNRVRPGLVITLGSERYKVVAITPDQVRLESVSTTKPYTVRLTAAP
jgi:hypothetical protein